MVIPVVFLSLLGSCMAGAVPLSIPMEAEDEDTGDYGDWAWAWLYAEYAPGPKEYHNIKHDWDWSVWGPYYYDVWELYSNDPEYPLTRTLVYYSTDGIHYYLDADAYVQFFPW